MCGLEKGNILKEGKCLKDKEGLWRKAGFDSGVKKERRQGM